MARTPTYRRWCDMIHRATSKTMKYAEYYVGRGITVCERWRKFEHFLADMGECPPGKMLERENNDLGYQPGNCVWATRVAQMNNRRNNVLVQCHGQVMTVAQASRVTGANYDTLHDQVTSGRHITTPGVTPINRRPQP